MVKSRKRSEQPARLIERQVDVCCHRAGSAQHPCGQRIFGLPCATGCRITIAPAKPCTYSPFRSPAETALNVPTGETHAGGAIGSSNPYRGNTKCYCEGYGHNVAVTSYVRDVDWPMRVASQSSEEWAGVARLISAGTEQHRGDGVSTRVSTVSKGVRHRRTPSWANLFSNPRLTYLLAAGTPARHQTCCLPKSPATRAPGSSSTPSDRC